jgi:CheY-like chemotaxis protein
MASQPHFFDVVFLDNQMPKMSGLEAIARLRASGREDLVVGVTGKLIESIARLVCSANIEQGTP